MKINQLRKRIVNVLLIIGAVIWAAMAYTRCSATAIALALTPEIIGIIWMVTVISKSNWWDSELKSRID
ncbi:hypothetical protein ALP03_200016 [Pseudomonas amygdali pv. tabaci]|uniref:Uncharacterized protein n=1 Tax=Pseudomonas amygdali pv. tabaci TaxID=322 RepID=A0A3M6HS97_PSEAJ|nr:hypothetical protein ALP03_200016 [Pseudomonas amygdali pv. tabaci]